MSDILDEIRAIVTPERLLRHPRATGAGVRVAVIDSGIDEALLRPRHPGMRAIQGGVFATDRRAPEPYLGRQSAPHGTTVADVILSIAPEAELWSADVIGPRGSCEVEVLLQAMDWAVEAWGCKIVNLSLGVPESRIQQLPRRHQLLRAVEECYFKDVLVVAAAHNDHPLTRSYPASFSPPILSVDKHLFDDPLAFAYRLSAPIEFVAHARGQLGPFAAEPATSWAAPHLAGIAARILSLHPGLKPFEVKTLLYWLSRPAD